MAKDNNTVQYLLEDPDAESNAPCFISEEIICTIPEDIEVIPVNNGPQSNIEIITVNNLPKPNLPKPSSVKKLGSPKTQTLPKAKRKHTVSERSKARADKVQSLVTLPESSDDSFIDFCGLKVPVKTLLQNADIRKQLAPFIEEVIVSDISDASDIEEIVQIQRKKPFVPKKVNKVAKPRINKRRKKSPEPTVKEGTGPFVEVLIPEVPDSSDVLANDIIVNLPLVIEKDAIKDIQEKDKENCILEEEIQLVTDSSDDEPIIEQNVSGCTKQTLSKKTNDIDISKTSSPIHKVSKTASKNIPNVSKISNSIISKSKVVSKKIPDNEVVVLNDAKKDNVEETSIIESDDWYYLNMRTTLKTNEPNALKADLKAINTDTSKIDNSTMATTSQVINNSPEATALKEIDVQSTNSLSVVKNIELDQVLSNDDSKIETVKRRKRKRKRRIPWSRHAIKGTRVSKNKKANLLGKIEKDAVKSVVNTQNIKESKTTQEPENICSDKEALIENPSVKSVFDKTRIDNPPVTSVLNKARIDNAPITSVLDKTNVNDNTCTNEICEILQEKTSAVNSDANSDEVKLVESIKQEPMLESNVDKTIAELLKINQSNNEMNEEELRIKLEQEVSWNINVSDQGSYQQKDSDQSLLPNEQQIQQSMIFNEKRNKLHAKKLFFGRKRSLGKCDNCGKRYKRLEALRRHQLTCKVEYNCAMCTFSTSDKIAFKEHLTNHILGNINNHNEEEETKDLVNDLKSLAENSIDLDNDSIDLASDSMDLDNDSIDLADELTSSVNDSIGSVSDSVNLINDSRGAVNDSTDIINGSTSSVNDSIGPVNNSINPVNKLIGHVNRNLTTYLNGDPLSNAYSIRKNNVFRYPPYIECYRCKICMQLFDTNRALRKHILLSLQGSQLVQSQRNISRCNRCGINGFSTLCELRSHMVTKCAHKKIMKIPYIRLERCKVPEKSKIETHYPVNFYCRKCLTTSTALERQKECEKCQSTLSFICNICHKLSLTYSGHRKHMSCAHNIDLHDFMDVPGKKCLVTENEDTSRPKLNTEKDCSTIDVTGSTKEINTVNINNTNKETDINVQESRIPRKVLEGITESQIIENVSLRNNEPSVPAISQITNFNKKVDQNHKEVPQIKKIKTIKVLIPIKRNDVKSKTEENNSKSCTKINGLLEEANHADISLNIQLEPPINAEDAFERQQSKNNQLNPLKNNKFVVENQIERFCIQCDENKTYFQKIKIGLIKEICKKCKMQLLYKCKDCHGVCKYYKKMAWHVRNMCQPPLRYFCHPKLRNN